MENHQKPPKTIENHQNQSKTMETIKIHGKPWKIMENQSKNMEKP